MIADIMTFQNDSSASDPLKINLLMSQVVPLGIFCFIMTFMGLFGNGTVLYSSIKYNAIKLDKVSLIFVRNLAVADIMYTITSIFPQMCTFFAGGWVLGPIYCFISAQLSFIPGIVNILTVLLITSYRLKIVTNPFSSISSTTARIMTLLTWVLGTTGPIISLAYSSKSIFSPTNVKCISNIYVHPQGAKIFQIAVGVLLMIPLLMITIENAVLCGVAVKSAKKASSSSFKALVLVCALAGVFIMSWVPYLVFSVMKAWKFQTAPALDLLAFHFIFINCFANPILYSVTNKRFGGYVWGVLSKMLCEPCQQVTASTTASDGNPTSSTGIHQAETSGL